MCHWKNTGLLLTFYWLIRFYVWILKRPILHHTNKSCKSEMLLIRLHPQLSRQSIKENKVLMSYKKINQQKL